MKILARWKARRLVRLALLRAAQARLRARKTPANVALVRKRREQVAQADRVIARHPGSVSGISPGGVYLIAEFEGLSLKPYRDAVGVWTIGYGHTEGVGPTSKPLVSKQAAMDLLTRDLDKKYAPYITQLRLPLNQNQYDALVSFVYNVGPGGVASGTRVGANLRARRWQAAADALLAWDKAGGRTLPGLTRRRQAERNLFLRPVRRPVR